MILGFDFVRLWHYFRLIRCKDFQLKQHLKTFLTQVYDSENSNPIMHPSIKKFQYFTRQFVLLHQFFRSIISHASISPRNFHSKDEYSTPLRYFFVLKYNQFFPINASEFIFLITISFVLLNNVIFQFSVISFFDKGSGCFQQTTIRICAGSFLQEFFNGAALKSRIVKKACVERNRNV